MTDEAQRDAAAAAAEQEAEATSEARADQEATAAAEQEAEAGAGAGDLAKAAIAFLEKANAVATATRAEVDPLDAVDTSVAGLGMMDPVLDDEGLATIKAQLASETCPAAVITTVVNVARLLAMKLLALG